MGAVASKHLFKNKLIPPATPITMIAKLFIFSCFIATSFCYFYHGPNCKIEEVAVETQICFVKPTKVCGTEADGEVIFQHVVPDEPVCVDIVDTLCFPAEDKADSCKEHERKACVPSGKIPEPYAGEDVCRYLPKATCETKEVKLPKRVCEPIEAKFLAW